jgi:hypothetical protein
MAIMKKIALEKNYVQVPNETAKAVEAKNNEKPISLQALGLIVNLWSYDVTTWELHKTELYNRYEKNARTSVSKAWDELVETKYIIEFKYRKGKVWDYVYIYRIEPFSEQEIEAIMAQCVEEYDVSSTVDFVQLKLCSTICTVQNVHISNEKGTKEEKKKDTKKNNKHIVNNVVNKEDDIQVDNIPYEQLDEILSDDVFDVLPYNREFLVDAANEFYTQFSLGRWSKKQWYILIDKLIDEIISNSTKIKNPQGYMYACLKAIAYKHDLKYGKAEIENKSDLTTLFLNFLEDEE